MTAESQASLRVMYDAASGRWADKMRTLGYLDGYRGFLEATCGVSGAFAKVIDVGAGTAAFSEAWIDVHGPPIELTLLEPSGRMLDRADDGIRAKGVVAHLVQGMLGHDLAGGYDEVLAAHVIEHCDDPFEALCHIRDLLRPGGRLSLVVSRPHWCNVIVWMKWRHRTFGREEIVSLVRSAGLNFLDSYDFPSGPPSRTSLGIVARR